MYFLNFYYILRNTLNENKFIELIFFDINQEKSQYLTNIQ